MSQWRGKIAEVAEVAQPEKASLLSARTCAMGKEFSSCVVRARWLFIATFFVIQIIILLSVVLAQRKITTDIGSLECHYSSVYISKPRFFIPDFGGDQVSLRRKFLLNFLES